MMGAILLAAAIACEVAGVFALRVSDGFTRLLPTVAVVVCMSAAAYLMSVVVRSMPISIVYATWSAVGTALVATIGIAFLDDPASPLRVFGFASIVLGVTALHLSGGH